MLLLAALSGCSTGNADSFVLLELFTSEGCFACPPADEDLAAIAERQRAGSRELAVAWHVDYWNGLGWVDPYALREATTRELAYADVLGSARVTPLMVAQGRDAFLGGSEESRAPAIERWLSTPGEVPVHLSAEAGDGEITAAIDVQHAPAGSELVVAVIQSGIATEVTAGENAGRTLTHENVVRAVLHLATDAGSADFPIPDGADPEDLGVVAFVQDREDLAVTGADLVQLGP